MRKYEVFYLKANDLEKIISEKVEAHSFGTTTVPSGVASTTVEFYDRYGNNLYMFAHVVKVEYKGEVK
jgi:hypothetical protein